MWYVYLILFFLPTFFANAVPVLWKKINFLNVSISEKHLGKNKTRRGLFLWVTVAMLTAFVLHWLTDSLPPLFWAYQELSTALLLGFLQWFWALFGDAVESFVKRRMDITPWAPLPVWDGVDYILGSFLFLSPLVIFSWDQYLFLLVLAPLASLIANTFSYWMGWKEVRR